jgi:CMP-N-acetylneuraminic acid synthetase
VWAIIPARGGSKRVRRKNIRPLAGKSLVQRSVGIAAAADCFSRIVVSTDDAEIVAEAQACGAEVPFVRPAHLADDEASSLDVLLHAVTEMAAAAGRLPDIVCLLQPTSPFLRPEQVVEGIDLFLQGDFNSLSSMKPVSEPPEWMFCLDSCGRASPLDPHKISHSRSALGKKYIENGAIYLVKAAYLMEKRAMYDFSRHGCLLMSAEDSLDIDTPEEWQYAEFLLQKKAGSRPDGS